MKTVYIHIGQHKTGTTSIQQTFYDNSEVLDRQEFSYFCDRSDNKDVNSINVSSWMEFDTENIERGSKIFSVKLVKKLSELKKEKIIISSEQLSWVFNQETLKEFKSELDNFFDKIIIITYLRRQDEQLVSHYQQGSKMYKSPASRFYGTLPQALPEQKDHHRLYLDYNKKISMWGDVFGDKNIIIRHFDRKYLYNGDIVEDFCKILNIKNMPSVTLNESSGFKRTKVRHLMASLKIDSKSKFGRIITENLDDSGKLLPSKDEAKKVYFQYKESNIKLNKRFKINNIDAIFDEDFSSYPVKSDDSWTEDSANKAILNIMKGFMSWGFFNHFKGVDINLLRDSAVALEKTDLKKAYELMSLAHQLRPSGPFIERKLDEYKQKLDELS